ncbi:MAG: hypothetical protein NC112_07500 [Oxalobacter formigenes]|nr:hypothetical protein [Oxalobacter formigenes]
MIPRTRPLPAISCRLPMCPPPPLSLSPDTSLDEQSAAGILDGLATRQNQDGGFGSFHPGDQAKSTASATCAVTEIILQIGITGRNHSLAVHPVVTGIIDYLRNYPPLSANTPYGSKPASWERPNAPWWKKNRPTRFHPLAALTGFALSFAPRRLPLYKNSLRQADHLIRAFIRSPFLDNAAEINSIKRLISHLHAGEIPVSDPPALYHLKIRQQINLLAQQHQPGTRH